MIQPRTLAHPPIKEAVLEVLLNYPPTVNLKTLGGYGALISSKYPNKDNVIQINGNANDGAFSRTTIGQVYYSQNKETYIQTRLNGFSFAQANQSYTDWNNFKPKAFEELKSFIDYTGPINLSRFSLRFINEIKVPFTEDIKEYVTILPNIDVINLPIRNLLSRVEVDKPEIGALAAISQLLAPPFEPTVSFFLDIDVIINNIPPIKVDLDFLAERFEKLRDLKNEIFFSSLTKKALDLYS